MRHCSGRSVGNICIYMTVNHSLFLCVERALVCSNQHQPVDFQSNVITSTFIYKDLIILVLCPKKLFKFSYIA